ncbi:MAG: glycosyltransferase [Gammaproteobacteria bacterium]|nr:glycosyltransferase [Gammaproteobacteria bacterium]
MSVIIVTYESDDCIAKCLESLFEFSDIDLSELEVIVVDNSPKTSARLRNIVQGYQNTTLIENEHNSGYGGGNNIGAKVASGECLLFLNPDTVFIEPVFLSVLQLYKTDQTLGAIGVTLVSEGMQHNNCYGYFPEKRNIFRLCLDKAIRIITGNLPKKNIYPWGAALFVKRDDFMRAGLFDESNFLFHEEPDLCHRLSPKRSLILSQRIIHMEGATFSSVAWRNKIWMQSLLYYIDKYGFNKNAILRNYIIIYYCWLFKYFLFGRSKMDSVKDLIALMKEAKNKSFIAQ